MLAAVLARANSAPPVPLRDEFYEIKQHILTRWGRLQRLVYQRIEDRCWGTPYESCGPHCCKCDGSGIYATKTIELEEWSYQDRVFHRPVRRLFGEEADQAVITIQGRISHRHFQLARVCAAALFLMFHPSMVSLIVHTQSGWDVFRKALRIASLIGPVPRSAVIPLPATTDTPPS